MLFLRTMKVRPDVGEASSPPPPPSLAGANKTSGCAEATFCGGACQSNLNSGTAEAPEGYRGGKCAVHDTHNSRGMVPLQLQLPVEFKNLDLQDHRYRHGFSRERPDCSSSSHVQNSSNSLISQPEYRALCTVQERTHKT